MSLLHDEGETQILCATNDPQSLRFKANVRYYFLVQPKKKSTVSLLMVSSRVESKMERGFWTFRPRGLLSVSLPSPCPPPSSSWSEPGRACHLYGVAPSGSAATTGEKITAGTRDPDTASVSMKS